MKEIGLILGVVESRISQIHASAVLRLPPPVFADFAARQDPIIGPPSSRRSAVP